MEKYLLNDNKTEISRLSLGTWAFSGVKLWGKCDEEEAIQTVHKALDDGINLFDSAEGYGDGQAENVLGKALKDRRSKCLIATKVSFNNLHYEDLIKSCEDSLTRLQTDYIDIYQVHWSNPNIPIEETFEALNKLKRDGKIINIGVCNFGKETFQYVKDDSIVTNQMPYSLIWRAAEYHFVKQLEDSKIALWAYSPLSQGLLTGKYKTIDDVPLNRRANRMYSAEWGQGRHSSLGFEKEIFEFLHYLSTISEETGYSMSSLALNFLKYRSNVGSILVGARSRIQLEDNIKSYNVTIPDEIIMNITLESEKIKEKIGMNADLWEDSNNGRGRIM